MSKKMESVFVPTLPVTLLVSLFVVVSITGMTHLGAQTTDCSSYIDPGPDQTLGPKTCVMDERPIYNMEGVPYRRVEMGISGSVEGYTMTDGSRYSFYFTDVPELSLAQRGAWGPYFHAVAQYHAEEGSGMTIFLPRSAADWNGKLFVMAHGSSPYPPVGELIPRQPGRYNRFMGANSYVGLLVDKGYAVAYTRRGSSTGKLSPGDTVSFRPGVGTVTLDDGTVLLGKSIDYVTSLLLSFTQIAKNFVEAQLGRMPTQTYWYGKSGGAALGRLINYSPGANVDAKGERIFDGMLIDDAGGGLYMPTIHFTRTEEGKSTFTVKPSEQDHLAFDEAHKSTFAYQIEIAHQGYAGNDYTFGDYISNKRNNARLLNQKGVGGKSRTYEIVGVSHADAGAVWRSDKELALENLDLSGLFDALIDTLDAWVTRGIEPPPTRSDAHDLAGGEENGAIELPEIACPTGVYHEFAHGGRAGRTGFVSYLRESRKAVNADTQPLPTGYDPSWLEPLDSRNYVVDMNRNTVRDTRDSIGEAWRRRAADGEKYGILGPNEKLTHARYVSCVASVASELVQQRLLSENAMLDYIDNALNSDIGKTAASSCGSKWICP